MAVIDGFLFAWNKNRVYGANLIADLDDSQMALQIAPGGKAAANHPAWVYSHLNVYLSVMEAIIKNESFEDPKGHQFGMDSKPLSDASVYASKKQLAEDFDAGHERIAQLLTQVGDDVLSNEIKLARWEKVMPTAAFALPYLMCNHENIHLGQISAWRRIQGLTSV